jgi:hypothetical protein
MDIEKDIERRSHAYALEQRINWDQPESVDPKSMEFQVFKNDYQNMHINVKMHKHNICMSLIYGMENTHKVVDTGQTGHFFSGFEERYGRMPTKFDEIILLKGKQYFSNINVDTVYSLLNWKLK